MRPGRLRRAPLDSGPKASVSSLARIVRSQSIGSDNQERVGLPSVEDGLPAGAAAQMGGQSPRRGIPVVVVGTLGLQTCEPADDPGRAEAALAAARGREGSGPAVTHFGVEPFEGGDGPPGHPPGGRHARNSGLAVHQHRAAAALALRAAPVLHRAHPELLPQHVQQRQLLVSDGYRRAVNDNLEAFTNPSSHNPAG